MAIAREAAKNAGMSVLLACWDANQQHRHTSMTTTEVLAEVAWPWPWMLVYVPQHPAPSTLPFWGAPADAGLVAMYHHLNYFHTRYIFGQQFLCEVATAEVSVIVISAFVVSAIVVTSIALMATTATAIVLTAVVTTAAPVSAVAVTAVVTAVIVPSHSYFFISRFTSQRLRSQFSQS
jgi:hypothetical protein